MNRPVRIGIIAAALATGAWVSSAVWRASRAVNMAEHDVAASGQFRFTLEELHPVATGMEQISAPAQFHDGALFKDRVYAASPAGLFAEDAQIGPAHCCPLRPLPVCLPRLHRSPPNLSCGSGRRARKLAFDGSRLRHLRPADAKCRKVTAVLGLSVGRVLFGTEQAGLLVFDGTNLTEFHSSLRDIHVTALAGNETDLWIGTLNRGLLHWRGGQATQIQGLPDKQVLSLALGPDGAVYAGTALGVAVVRNEAMERVIGEGVFARTLQIDGAAAVRGNARSGLYEIPLGGGRPHFLETSAAVRGLFAAEGRLFAAADQGIFEARQWSPVLRPANAVLADRNIAALSMDHDGQLWVGYFDRGLDIVDAALTRARHLEDQHLFCVNRIVHGPTTAVATANGLVLFDASGQKKQVLGKDQGVICEPCHGCSFQRRRHRCSDAGRSVLYSREMEYEVCTPFMASSIITRMLLGW